MTAVERSASPAPSLAEILASVGDSPSSYLAAARALGSAGGFPGLEPLPVALLSTFTLDLVSPYLVVEGARRGLGFEVTHLPFGQLEQQVLDARSVLYEAKAQVVVVAIRIEETSPELGDRFLSLSSADVDRIATAHVERVARLVAGVRERSASYLLVWNQPPGARVATGLADPLLERSQQGLVQSINEQLVRALAPLSGVGIFDAFRAATEIGTLRWYDDRLRLLARAPLSAVAQMDVGRRLARHVRAQRRPPCKCLVVDLDNTLWGGVLGEDGVGGIALGDEYPGNAFKEFQHAVLGLRDRGVLLAIASKNNDADVAEAFAQHSDMVLKPEHFAARQIHWNDKASSLRAIASDLNIGIDALAFFDDNPVEREWVRAQLPEVTVIDVPKEPHRYVAALDASAAFDHLVLTAEDRARATVYQSDAQRRDLHAAAASVDDFLRALEMKVTIGRIDDSTRTRVTQLLAKTNQFNVTTRRHTETDLAELLSHEGSIGFWMRAADRFGDNGLVAVAIATRDGARAHRLDTFLMSCRVLGRSLEFLLLREVALAAIELGSETLLGEFIPTRKNAPAAAFFAEAGMAKVESNDNLWKLDLTAGPPAASDAIEIVRP